MLLDFMRWRRCSLLVVCFPEGCIVKKSSMQEVLEALLLIGPEVRAGVATLSYRGHARRLGDNRRESREFVSFFPPLSHQGLLYFPPS